MVTADTRMETVKETSNAIQRKAESAVPSTPLGAKPSKLKPLSSAAPLK